MARKKRAVLLVPVLAMAVTAAEWTPVVPPRHSPPAAAAPGDPTPDPGAADPSADPSAVPSADPSAPPPDPSEPPPDPSEPPAADPGATHDPGAHPDLGGPKPEDFVSIRRVRPNVRAPRPGRNASRGTFVTDCGRNQNGHYNPDNFIVAPGVQNGAHHMHDYVGNLSTDGFSTDESLSQAGTTCRAGDKSVFYWPVLRLRDAEDDNDQAAQSKLDGNVGRILVPASVNLRFRGNPRSKVTAMPPFIRIVTGDAKAATNGPANARAQWTCSGFTNRVTTQYPLCPRGSRVTRILDFPSCWDGRNVDSANHRTHIVFPDARTGACPAGTRAVPQLRMTLSYNVPARAEAFALDSFPEQLHNPGTDHGDFANLMPARLMDRAVSCINRGRRC